MLRLGWQGLLCVVVTAMLVGCTGSSGTGKGPKMARVTGPVTLDGTPVPGATVIFAPKPGAIGTAASGTTDAQGRYSLNAVPDSYVVTIVKTESTEAEGAKPTSMEDAMKQKMKREREAKTKKGAAPNVKDLLPVKYSSATTSNLTADVKDGTNDIPFRLDSK